MADEIEAGEKTRSGPRPLGYQPSLDGVRALAIVCVLAFHATTRGFLGGGLGVDIFFTLSGFLITTLILEELERAENHDFGFRAFYARRALRLLPALYTLILVLAVYDLVGPRSDTVGLFGTLVASGLYVNNLTWMWGQPNLLMAHTWSLGLEEQFYLIMPVALVTFVRRRALPLLAWLLVAAIVVTLLARARELHGTYTLLLQRPDAIAIGCLLAIVRWLKPARVAALLAPVGVGIAGLVGLVLVIWGDGRWFPSTDLARGWYLFASAMSALLIGHLVSGSSPLGAVMSMSAPWTVGRISYGLYLWHFPIFIIVATHTSLTGGAAVAVKFVLSFAAASLSWFGVERPALRVKQRFEPSDRVVATAIRNES